MEKQGGDEFEIEGELLFEKESVIKRKKNREAEANRKWRENV